MTSQRMTFGEHLKQLALSVDFIDSGHYDLVKRHIKKYLETQLGATQIGLFESTLVDERPGIQTVWSFPRFSVHQRLYDGEGNFRRQLALAIGTERNLWVVSKTNERLNEDNHGVDAWGNREDEDLPPFYVAPHAEPSRTAIVMITRNALGNANGAFLIEIGRRVGPSRVLRREMQLIADSIGLMHATDQGTREQREGTSNAISTLADLLPHLELDTGPRPLLFVASSSDAPPEVMEAIDEVLAEFEEHVFVRHWGQMHTPGNINVQLANEIKSAQYGICYLSEQIEDPDARDQEGHAYRDNPNVLVEAGMLHMVTSANVGAGTGWIPIREDDSASVPFDLENQRMVIVSRDGGAFDAGQFSSDLAAKLRSLLDTEEAASAPSGPADDT